MNTNKTSWIFLIVSFLFFMRGNTQNVIEKIIGDSLKIEIKNCGDAINSKYPEYAPIITADRSVILFTARRPQTKKEIRKKQMGKEQIYISNINEFSNEWDTSVMIKDPINLSIRHSSNIALSNDGSTLLMYRDDEEKNGDIFISELIGTEWSELVKLPSPLNTTFHESSASISPDGRIIYFISDRPNGSGGRDIWYCTKNIDGTLGDAINLGNTINSAQDEEAVFIHPDGKTLYFSSKRNGGLGGYDIYKTTFENNQWSIPQNIGDPVNTINDDVFYVLSADGKFAYYASDREGTLGGTDVFEIKYTSLDNNKNKGPQLVLLKGSITEEETGKPIGANIEVVDNNKNEVVSNSKSNSATGKYLISLPAGKDYGITVDAKGYLFHSENISIPDTAGYEEVIKNISPKKIIPGSKIILKNIFFEFATTNVLPSSQKELSRLLKLMKDNPTLAIEISGHTDNIGTVKYNQYLSEWRAKAIVDYLVSEGISNDRLSYKGYGLLQPIASNETEKGRALNRRTEFLIVSNDSLFKFEHKNISEMISENEITDNSKDDSNKNETNSSNLNKMSQSVKISSTQKKNIEQGFYIVQKGETLYRIYSKTGVSTEKLRQLNHITNNTIFVGQKIKLK